VRTVVTKQTCPKCKGGRYISVTTPVGREKLQKCPDCGGQGYKIRVTR
jgi:DnaJ-class molecular chaperone